MLETADRLVTEERQPSVQQFLLLVGGLRAMTGGGPHPARCSTPTCCARWQSPATRRPSTTAPAAATPVRTAGSTRRPVACCAACRLPGSAGPAAATLAVLGALLAGDWPVVHAAEPRHLKEASGLVAAYLAWHLERGLRSLQYVER